MPKQYSVIDKICIGVESALQTLFTENREVHRPSPAHHMVENSLSENERTHIAGLMRIDHTGEVCAQALYAGQAWLARNDAVRQKMLHAAVEENDHLGWCEERLRDLNTHRSYLNWFWYTGSFSIGVAAGLLGDPISLGFIVETERQVVKHLENHLASLPADDKKSHAILQQMREDEEKHATTALRAGARELPLPVRWLMRGMAKVMTTLTYHI